MSRIERGLHEHYASASSRAQQPSQTSGAPGSSSETATDPPDLIETPFAKVNAVTPGSPAEQAGLRPGDAIRRFGHVNWLNHEKLSKIAETVQRNEDVGEMRVELSRVIADHPLKRPVLVKVLRKGTNGDADEEVQLQLTPRRGWGGRGLLGCHLLPT